MRTLQIGDDWFEEKDGGLGRYYFELLRHLPATGTTTRGLVVGSSRVTESTDGKVLAFARPNDSMLHKLKTARRTALAEIESGSIDLVASHFALYTLPSLTDFDQCRSWCIFTAHGLGRATLKARRI